jgi:hypothetical protein
MLFDDPFGAVDAPTAMALLERLLLGPLLKGKTRASWRDHGWRMFEGMSRLRYSGDKLVQLLGF